MGSRIRAARQRASLSQAELADGIVDTSYLSLIENGRRRPSAAVLEALAAKLGTSVEALSDDRGGSDDGAAHNALVVCAAMLAAGDADAVLRETETWVRREGDLDDVLLAEFLHVRGRAYEHLGRVDAATEALRAALRFAARADAVLLRINITLDLVRCLRERGDIGEALDLARDLRDALPPEIAGTALHARLLSTVIGLHYKRGDFDTAHHEAQRALLQFASRGDAASRGMVLWNASLAAEAVGDGFGAVALANEALELLRGGAGVESRWIGQLHVAIAWLYSRVTPADFELALRSCDAAAALYAVSGSELDLAVMETERARALWGLGDFGAALVAVRGAVARMSGAGSVDVVQMSHARIVEARVLASMGDVEGARAAVVAARAVLDSAAVSRANALEWRDLAEVFAGLGLAEDAVAAYRYALDDAGIGLGTGAAVGTAATEQG